MFVDVDFGCFQKPTLIDSGATHNFIPADLLTQFAIPTQISETPLTVSLADNSEIRVEEQVQLEITIGKQERGLTFQQSFFVLKGLSQPILGMPHLNEFNPKIDFVNYTLEYDNDLLQCPVPAYLTVQRQYHTDKSVCTQSPTFSNTNQFADLPVDDVEQVCDDFGVVEPTTVDVQTNTGVISDSIVGVSGGKKQVAKNFGDVAQCNFGVKTKQVGKLRQLELKLSSCKTLDQMLNIIQAQQAQELPVSGVEKATKKPLSGNFGKIEKVSAQVFMKEWDDYEHVFELKSIFGGVGSDGNVSQLVGRDCTGVIEGSHVNILHDNGNADNSDFCTLAGNDGKLFYTHRTSFGEHSDENSGDKRSFELQQLSKSTMEMLQQKYGSVFKEPAYPIARESNMQHSIQLIDPQAQPPKRRLYPLNQAELTELKAQIELFLKTNRIRPSRSPYGAPILFAKKKGGALRLCIDYRLLNKQTVIDSFPLPRIDELLARLQGAKVFSKLDLRDGYHQIPVEQSSIPRTAFSCRYGTFEWLVMPFGLSGAPGTFQRVMNTVFLDLLDRGVLVYLDDILIYSKTQQEHVELLQEVFARLQKYQLYIKESKCSLFLSQIEFLGHVISENGVSVDISKTDAVKKWPIPTSLNELQQFLGLCNYYRKFIFKFSDIANPLTMLTRKNVPFLWGEMQQAAFDRLKVLLCSAPVLKVFDSALPTRIICDASNFAIGAVLEQQHRGQWFPVEFLSKKLNAAEQNYSATDREFVAIRCSLERWQHLLSNIKFILYTDHAALTYLQTSSHVNRRNARWLEFLSQFNFEMLHIKGAENVADHLSRIKQSFDSDPTNFGEVLMYVGEMCDDVMPRQHATSACLAAVTKNSNMCSINTLGSFISVFDKIGLHQAIVEAQNSCVDGWYVDLKKQASSSGIVQFRHGILCRLHRDHFCPVVPSVDLQQQILRDLHASGLGGHVGFGKLLVLLRCRFYWPSMRKDADQFVRSCVVCQRTKIDTRKQAGLLQPLPVPDRCFMSISMDFITNLPLCDGKDSIFSIVDRFSKYCVFIPIKFDDTSAEQVARLLFDHWICKHGMPKTIVSDRDPRFTSQFWQCLMSMLDSKVALSTAYHPQTDGQTERFHRTIEQVLRAYCSQQQSCWCNYLQQSAFAINNTVHAATQQSAFDVMYLQKLPLPIDNIMGDCTVPAVKRDIEARRLVNQSVQQHLLHAQAAMQKQANKGRRHVEFEVGDQVLLNTKHLPLPTGFTRKLASKFLGPIPILSRVGKVAYKVELPAQLHRLHPVFHVSLLKKFTGTVVDDEEPVFKTADGGSEYEVEAILAHRKTRRSVQFLVKWKGFQDFHNSWEPVSNLVNCSDMLSKYKKANNLT